VVNSASADAHSVALVVAAVDGIDTGFHLGAPDGPLLAIDSSFLDLSQGNTG